MDDKLKEVNARLKQALLDRLSIELNIKELEQQIEASRVILVPECIKIRMDSCRMMISFGENQILFVNTVYNSGYSVYCGAGVNSRIKCKLVKTTRAELKRGDLAYCTDGCDPVFLCLTSYCVIMGKESHAYVKYETGVLVGVDQWKHWYKVERV